jgi:tetratricopeptide (TPR) repeat protein
LALGYTILLGGTGRGELGSWLVLMNAAIAAYFVISYFMRAASEADRLDRGILLALLLFAAAAVLSQFLRQSFDAALGALTGVAALFVLRGDLSDARVRAWFARLFGGLAITLTFLTAALWVPQAVEWWNLAGGDLAPPLDLNFRASPWGHRHDLALLVVMLYPSLWIGRVSAIRVALGVTFGALALAIVILDGSRNLWLAMLGATAVALLPIVFRRLRHSSRARRWTLIGLVVAGALFVASGLAAAVADRVFNLQSLGWRSAMWTELIDAWARRPLAGFGPGSFAWILPTTDYYDTSTWAPRHPDSAFFQLMGEGGVLGLAASLLVLAVLAGPVLRGRSVAARWALAAFVFAAIGANPTDFPFLVAVAIGWAAYAAPRPPADAGAHSSNRVMRVAYAAGLVLVGVSFAATSMAGIAYASARTAAENRDLETARDALAIAHSLDPGMALYPRQLGTLEYIAGNPEAGIAHLEEATRMNPSDDLAWRTLALARDAAGDSAGALNAASEALAAQRSDASNMLLMARLLADDGRSDEARELLAEVVQAWPAVVAAPGWNSYLPGSTDTSEIVDAAIERWESGLSSPEPLGGQGLWLAALGDRPDLDGPAIAASGVSEPLGLAALRVFRCDPSLGGALDQLSDSDKRTQLYWQLRIREAALTGESYDSSLRLLQIMKGYALYPGTADDLLRPVHEPGFNNDVWGYRREQIVWRTDLDLMPSIDAGEARWLFDPDGAVDAAGSTAVPPSCR